MRRSSAAATNALFCANLTRGQTGPSVAFDLPTQTGSNSEHVLARDSGRAPPQDFPKVVGRISCFVNAGVCFIIELCKMRAFAELWDEIARRRYGVSE